MVSYPSFVGEEGIKNLIVVTISFMSGHIETMEEIDIEYRELAEERLQIGGDAQL